jgi:hypothetical protein
LFQKFSKINKQIDIIAYYYGSWLSWWQSTLDPLALRHILSDALPNIKFSFTNFHFILQNPAKYFKKIFKIKRIVAKLSPTILD